MTVSQKLKMFALIAVVLGAGVWGVLNCAAKYGQLFPPAVQNEAAVSAQVNPDNTAAIESETEQQKTDTEKQKENIGYVSVDDKMDNLQLKDAHTPVYDKYTLTERQKKGLTTALPAITPYKSAQKIAYLTFAGGPDAKNTPAALAVLREKKVSATFYVVGQAAKNHPDIIKQIFADKHALGNHCYEHNYKKLYPNKENFLADLKRTDEIIHGIIGVRPLIIRAPGGTPGHFTKEYPTMLKQNGYVEHDWNIDTGDATSKHSTAATQLNTMLRQMKRDIADDKMLIILMHLGAGKEETVKALPQIIDTLKNMGYDFGVVTPMTPKPW